MIRDCFVFGGTGILGLGLGMLAPWLGVAVVGLVLLLLGLFPVPGAKP